MSQSKSLAIPFIIVAVLVFGGALAWKTFFKEEVTVKPQAVVVKKTPPKVLKPIEKQEVIEEEPVSITIDEYEERRLKGKELMQLAMTYKTPESLLRAIEYHQERNEHEEVDKLIDFLISKFPDYQLPKALAK